MHIICRDILSLNEVLESETYQEIPLVFQGAKPNAKVQDLLATLVDSMENRFPYTDIVEATLNGSFLNCPANGSDSIPG